MPGRKREQCQWLHFQKKQLIEIDRLTDLEKLAFGKRHGKNDFYKYLEAVLKEYWRWRGDGERKSHRVQLASIKNISSRKGRTTLHVLIEATSDQEARVRNRWVQGLRFAQRRKNRSAIEKNGLKIFCKKYGGISGCRRVCKAEK